MKKHRILALFTFAFCLLPFALVHAQDAVNAAAAVQAADSQLSTPQPSTDQVVTALLPLFAGSKYRDLLILLIPLLWRLLAKIVQVYVHSGPPTQADHDKAAELQASPSGALVAWLLDVLLSIKSHHPQADPSLGGSKLTPRTFALLPVAFCLLPLLAVGCTTAIQNGYVVSQTTRGLGFKLSAISQTGTPGEIYFGYFSTTSELVPTAKGTNASGVQIASPNYGASFSFEKSGLLSEKIDETRSFGLTTVLDSGATNSAPIIQPK